jgi:phosphoribosylanthranilate isomerase
MIWIKICGTTKVDDALASMAAGADALGFIFTASPRRITPQIAAEIIAKLPESIEKIGVVVNETPQALAELAAQTGLTALQLHGDEPADQLAGFRRALSGHKLIKTLQIRELFSDPHKLDGYLHEGKNIDAILLDSGSAAARGGTGMPFDWNAALPIVQRIKEIFPVIIGGGLSSANVAEAIRLFKPWGVEVVSSVEVAPGKKDAAKLSAFIAAARGVLAT